jgi:DNA-binding IclR family transcriptional regulator
MQRSQPVQVLGKAGQILEALTHEPELSAAQLAERTGEPRSTVYRLLATLSELDFVEGASRRGTYRLGLKLLELGAAVIARFDERQAALPVMERIHAATEETVFLCIRRAYEAVCIERIDGRWVRSMALALGGSLPLHIGGAPKALLASEPREFWEEYARSARLSTLTSAEPMTFRELTEDLDRVRTQGFSISDGDVVTGMAAVGAPIFDYRGQVRASLSISGPRPLVLEENASRTQGLVVDGAAEISRTLGYTGDRIAAGR